MTKSTKYKNYAAPAMTVKKFEYFINWNSLFNDCYKPLFIYLQQLFNLFTWRRNWGHWGLWVEETGSSGDGW